MAAKSKTKKKTIKKSKPKKKISKKTTAKKKVTKKTTAKKKVAKKTTAKKKVTKKTTAKKKVTKKTTTKKKVTKKTTAKKKVPKKSTTKKIVNPSEKAKPIEVKKVEFKRPKGFEKATKARTKSQILTQLAEHTNLSKKQVGDVFEILGELIGHDLEMGPGTFTVPGLMKVVVVRKPATPARQGINPFTGEEMMFQAKPARNVVKVRPLKGLKDMV